MSMRAAHRNTAVKKSMTRQRPELRAPAQRVVLPDLSWGDYIQIGGVLRDRPALRLTFDTGTLEIMVTSREHESFKTRLGRFIEILAEVFNLVIEPGGNMTFQNEGVEKGLEGDNCWWIEHAEQVLGKLTWDSAVDPPPDLVLEIEISRSALSRMAIYAALKVPQVWCYNGKSLRINLLQPDGTYLQSNESPTFAQVPVGEIPRFLQPAKDYLTIQNEFRAWAKRHRRRMAGVGKRNKSK